MRAMHDDSDCVSIPGPPSRVWSCALACPDVIRSRAGITRILVSSDVTRSSAKITHQVWRGTHVLLVKGTAHTGIPSKKKKRF